MHRLGHEDGRFQAHSVSVSLHHAEDADWLALRRHTQRGLLARRLALQCVQAGIGRHVRVQLEYWPNSALPESVGVWTDGVSVPLPPGVRPVATRDAARAMVAASGGADYQARRGGRRAGAQCCSYLNFLSRCYRPDPAGTVT